MSNQEQTIQNPQNPTAQGGVMTPSAMAPTTPNQGTQKQRRIVLGGSESFSKVLESGKSIKKVDYEHKHTYYRAILKVYRTNEKNSDGEMEAVYHLGRPSLWMFQEILGVKIKDKYLGNEEGFEIEENYAIDVAQKLLAKALVYNSPEVKFNKTAYANLIRYINAFAAKFKPVDDEDKCINFAVPVVDLRFSDAERANPDFDEDTAILKKFAEASKKPIPMTANEEDGEDAKDKTVMQAFKLALEKAIAAWAFANTDLFMTYTYTASANFSSSCWFSGGVEPVCNDGGIESGDVEALTALATAMARYNFEAEGGAEGADRNSKTYFEAFNKWLNAPSQNRKIMSGPNPNGLVFVVSSECVADGTSLMKDEKTNKVEFSSGFMNWSGKKTEKVMAAKTSGLLYSDPDCCHAILNFNIGKDKGEAGKDMLVTALQKPNLRCPYAKVAELLKEVYSPVLGDRIKSFKKLDVEALKAAFKKKYISEGWDQKLTAEDKLKCAKGIELLVNKKTAEDIEAQINGGFQINPTVGGGASMFGGINLTDEAPAPQPQPQMAQPQPQPQPMPQPQMAQPAPQPMPQPQPQMAQPQPQPMPQPQPQPMPQMVQPQPQPMPNPGLAPIQVAPR